MTKLSYNIREAAEVTGLSEYLIDKAIKSGKLRAKASEGSTAKKIGKRVILAADLERYVAGLEDA